MTGPNTVVESMGAGRTAAVLIEKYLNGEPVEREYSLVRPKRYVEPVELSEEEVEKARRPESPTRRPSLRKKNFKEVELGLSEAAARAEARRCLRCDLETQDGQCALKKMKPVVPEPACPEGAAK